MIFSKSSKVANLGRFDSMQERLLQSNANRVIMVNKIPEIGGVVVETVAVPGHESHFEKDEKKEKGASTEEKQMAPPPQNRC